MSGILRKSVRPPQDRNETREQSFNGALTDTITAGITRPESSCVRADGRAARFTAAAETASQLGDQKTAHVQHPSPSSILPSPGLEQSSEFLARAKNSLRASNADGGPSGHGRSCRRYIPQHGAWWGRSLNEVFVM